MISLWLGLTIANMLLLSAVFLLGLQAVTPDGTGTTLYVYHVSLAIAAGLMCLLAHLSVYTYFMATCKWLVAATEKAGLAVERFVIPAGTNKRRSFPVVMGAIAAMMLAMFIGAAEDPTAAPVWSVKLHIVAASVAWVGNLMAAFVEYRLIRRQQRLMDDALQVVNHTPGLIVQQS